MPVTGLSPHPFQPSSGVVVLPIMIAPARARRATKGASSSGTRSAKTWEPPMVFTPFVNARSLMVTGTPYRGPGASPRASAASASRAASIARSAVGVHTALRRGFRASSRAIVACTTSTGDKSRFPIRWTSSTAEVQARSSFMGKFLCRTGADVVLVFAMAAPPPNQTSSARSLFWRRSSLATKGAWRFRWSIVIASRQYCSAYSSRAPQHSSSLSRRRVMVSSTVAAI